MNFKHAKIIVVNFLIKISFFARTIAWRERGTDTRPVGLTQEAQHRLHREYRSTKVAGYKLRDGELSVRDAWLGCKTRGLRKRVFRTRVEFVGLPTSVQRTRAGR